MTVELAPSPPAPSGIPASPYGTPVSAVVCTSLAPADGLIRGLRRAPGVEVVGITTSGAHAERLVSSRLPDVVLVDLHAPGIDSIGITRWVRFASPTTKVAILTTGDAAAHLYGAFKAGASGHTNARSGATEIAAAVHSLATGKPDFPSYLASEALHETGGGGSYQPDSDRTRDPRGRRAGRKR